MHRSFLVLALGLFAHGAAPAQADFISEVLGDNPRGFWILNDAPGGTTTAADSTTNAFNGIYGAGVTPQGTAGPSWVPASGLVASLSGSGNITFSAPLDLGANDYTIQAWIKPALTSLQNASRVVASGRGLDGYGFGTTSGAELVFTSFSQTDYVTTTLTLVPNQWSYVGVVVDANDDAHFYVNGAFVQTVAGTLPTNPATLNFTIGSRSGPLADEFFTGGLAGISVYDTALTATQIQEQYNAAAVPEPSSLLLIGAGAAWAGCVSRRRARNAQR